METTPFKLEDHLHRLMKESLDNGKCKSIAEAKQLFSRYRIHIEISATDAIVPEHQMTLLTTVALACRVCHGGVTVDDIGDVNLTLPLSIGKTLNGAITMLGGILGKADSMTPTITIGNKPKAKRHGFHIRTSYAGWRGGILPAHTNARAQGPKAIPPACTLSAALAVNEAYFFMSDASSIYGQRKVGLSLWEPSTSGDWLTASEEPELTYLPSKLWLIGLGHLGQAYLWTLGLLPYIDPSQCLMVLQDKDVITKSTESTSVLSNDTNIGLLKTRAMAKWAEDRGFKTSIYERTFDASARRQLSEPAVALCGIDNTVGRTALDQVGFDFIVEAGLGSGHHDFRTIRIHTLPGKRKASEIWKQRTTSDSDVTDNEAYQQLLRDGTLDQCGLTLLAGKAVGAPFVGMTAASLAIAEILRLLHGGKICQLIDIDLQAVEHRVVTLNPHDFSSLNPGFVTIPNVNNCNTMNAKSDSQKTLFLFTNSTKS